MTGFARADGAHGEIAWSIEAKSVNGRGLDLRFRLPPGYDFLEIGGRAAAAERFSRGTLSIQLTLQRGPRGSRYRLNRAALDEMIALLAERRDAHASSPPRLEILLGLPGVLEPAWDGETEEARSAREAAVLASLGHALDRLLEARRTEGTRLGAIVEEHLAAIEELTRAARRSAADQPEQLQRRLKEQLASLLGGQAPVPEERLAQEIALLATKADVGEELDRLAAHLAQARELARSGAAVGRKFDFLCQELNREANTLCSKSASVELSRIGIELKTAIDRLREQVQNLE
jgi:uncharacterized protein (TIGR00255 family)